MSFGARHVIALLLVSGTAAAQQPTQAQIGAVRSSCRSDYQSYCASVPTGGSAALNCLEQHVNQVSPACQSAVSAVQGGTAPPTGSATERAHTPVQMPPREKMVMVRRSCGPDFRTYCRGVPLGSGQAMACLAENKPRLSPSCRNVLADVQVAR